MFGFDDIVGAVSSAYDAVKGVLPAVTTTAKSLNSDYGSLINAGLNAFGGLMSNQQSANSAQAAQDFSAQQFATRYQTTVNDMKAAGLNPMLAYSQGGGSPPSGVSYTAQNPFAGVSSAFASTRNLEAQRENLLSGADLNDAQKKLANDTAAKVVEETKNVGAAGDVLKETVNQLKAQVDLMNAQGLSAKEQTKVLTETITQIHNSGVLSGLDIQAAKNFGNLSRNMGELKPLADFVIGVVRMLKGH